MGFSRETFYRYHRAIDEEGIEALLDKNPRKPNLKNRVDEAIEFPAYGQLSKRGIFVSPSGVRSIWLRNRLGCLKLRLTALEKKVAEEGIILTENQIIALEKKKDEDIANGEIDTAHPGYLGSQDGCVRKYV